VVGLPREKLFREAASLKETRGAGCYLLSGSGRRDGVVPQPCVGFTPVAQIAAGLVL